MKKIIIIVISILTINIELSSKDVKINGISKLSKGTFPQPFYDIYNVSNPKYPNNSTLGNPHNNTAISTGYYFVDSDQNLSDMWKIEAQIADTNEEKELWTKIASGPRQKSKDYWLKNEEINKGFPFFRNPALPTQNGGNFFETGVAYGTDSTDDAIAGPLSISLDKNFYFNGIRYDSVYISTNGIVCLTNRRYIYETNMFSKYYKKRKLDPITNSAYDPESMDWFVTQINQTNNLNAFQENRTRYGNGLSDTTQDDFGYKYAVLGGQYSNSFTNWSKNPPSPFGGIRAKGGSLNDLNLNSPDSLFSNYNQYNANNPFDGSHKAALIAPFFGNMQLDQTYSSYLKNDYIGRVFIKRDPLLNKFIIYFVNISFSYSDSLNSPKGKGNGSILIIANAQVILDANDNSVTIVYEKFSGENGLGIDSKTMFRYNTISGVRGFARNVNFNRTNGPTKEPFNNVAESEQFTNYYDREQNAYASYPNNNLKVKFKQWQNTFRAVDIQYRIKKENNSIKYTESLGTLKSKYYEIFAEDSKFASFQPSAIFQNLSNDIQGPNGVNYVNQDANFQTRFVIQNSITGRVIYNKIANIDNNCLGLIEPNWQICNQDSNVRVNYLGKDTNGIKIVNNNINTNSQNYISTNVYNGKLRNGLPTYEYAQVLFPPFTPNTNETDVKLINIGLCKAYAIVEPINPNNKIVYSDAWQFDDTISTNLYIMNRLSSFSDDVTEFHVINDISIPSVNKWVNINSTVESAELVSRHPLSPRGKFAATNNPYFEITSPVIKMNRVTIDNNEPDIYPGGDEIRSFPIDMTGKFNSTISFSIQRIANRPDWERAFGDDALIGPEPRALLNGDIFAPFNTAVMAVSANPDIDRLSVQILRPSNDSNESVANPTEDRWRYHPRRRGANPETKVDAFSLFGGGGYMTGFLESDKDSSLALPKANGTTGFGLINSLRANIFDDGFDFEYNRYFVAIPDTFIRWQNNGAKNFRFRIKTLLNNDKKCETCIPDDDDDFFVDNIEILTKEKDKTDFEVTSTQVILIYTQVPASQATNYPVRVKVANNTLDSNCVYIVKSKIFKDYIGLNDKPVYCKVQFIPKTSPNSEIELKMPDFNSRNSGPGKYRIISYVKAFGGDINPTNDTAYYDFEIVYGNSFAYDPIENPHNDVFETTGRIGRGLNIESNTTGGTGSLNGPISIYDENMNGAGENGGSMSGQFLMKFELFNTDTLYGYQAFFAIFGDFGDIAFSIYREGGGYPPFIVNNSLIYRKRLKDDISKEFEFNKYVNYIFKDELGNPKKIVLQKGLYWMSISQLGTIGLELGASKSRMGMRTMIVGIPNSIYSSKAVGGSGSSFLIHKEFRQHNSSGNMVNNNLFAVENLRGSGQGLGFMPSVGNPAYAHLHHFGTSVVDKQTLTLNRGSWIPMIRPLFGLKSYSNKIEYVNECAEVFPVELVFFKGASRNDGIDLFWETASEINCDKFIIERNNDNINNEADWVQIAQIKGNGNSKIINSYNWTDKNVAPKEAYQYRLRQVDLDGTQNCYTTNIVTVTYDKNLEFALYPNSPNPFTNNTNITYVIPNFGSVKVEVLDVSGNVVSNIIDKEITAGTHTIEWDGKNNNGNLLSSGTYLCRISSDGRTETIKMTIKR